jgi:hypothetical protein
MNLVSTSGKHALNVIGGAKRLSCATTQSVCAEIMRNQNLKRDDDSTKFASRFSLVVCAAM